MYVHKPRGTNVLLLNKQNPQEQGENSEDQLKLRIG